MFHRNNHTAAAAGGRLLTEIANKIRQLTLTPYLSFSRWRK
jgi:hypothetical protein